MFSTDILKFSSSRRALAPGSWLVCFSLLTSAARATADGSTDPGYLKWAAHRDALAKDPTVQRLYEFDAKFADTVPNLAQSTNKNGWGDLTLATNPHYLESAPIQVAIDVPFWTTGRWPGQSALNFGTATHSAGRSHFYGTGDNHFSVELWVRPLRDPGDKSSYELATVEDTLTSGWKITSGPSFTSFALGRPAGKNPGQGAVTVYSPHPLTGHVWHQVVAELDDTQIALYVDGKLAGQKTFDGQYTQPVFPARFQKLPEFDNAGLIFGNHTGFAPPKPTDGSLPPLVPAPVFQPLFDLDEAVVFDRALSGDEVAAEYAAGAPSATPDEQIAAHHAYLARQTLLDSVALAIPTESFGYFAVNHPWSASATVPVAAASLGATKAVFTLSTFDDMQLTTVTRPIAADGTLVKADITLPKCALYNLDIQLEDGAGAILKTVRFPIAGTVAVTPAANWPATSPLAGHDIVQKHPADGVLGARADRMIAPFLRVMPDGSYDWRIPDACIAAAQKSGLEVLYTIYPPFNMPHNSPSELAKDPERWADWVKTLVTHFQGKVHYWEVWNEPNAVPGLNASTYVTLLKTAYPVIHQVDPTNTVLGGCGVYSVPEWTEAVLQAGGGPYMDVLSIHNYVGTSPITYRNRYNKVRQVHALLRKYLGHEIPVWNSEGGIHQPSRIGGQMLTDDQLMALYGSRANRQDGWANAGVDAIMMTTEQRSACWNVQSILLDLADGNSRYYTLMGAGTFYPFKSSSEGLPTEKGISYAQMASAVGDAKTIQILPLSNSKAAGILVTSLTGRRTAILFSDTPLEFTFDAAPGTVFHGADFLGNPLQFTTGPSGLTLKTADEPLYINDVPADFAERHLLSSQAFPITVQPGQSVSGTLAVTNPDAAPLGATLTASSGAGTVTAPPVITVAAHETLSVPYQFTADATSRGTRTILFSLRAGGKSLSQLEVPFYAEGPATMVRPATAIALDGDPAPWAGVPAETADQLSNVAIGKPDVGFANNNTWNGPSDCSFSVKTQYRAGDDIYVLIDVTDDKLYPTPPGNPAPWLWDGLELFVDTRPNSARGTALSPGAQQIMVIPNITPTNGPCTALNLAHQDATVNATFVGHATAHGYLLEGKISPNAGAKWTIEPGNRIGMDFAIDDNDDGVKRKVQLVLHGSGLDGVDTSQWGEYELGK